MNTSPSRPPSTSSTSSFKGPMRLWRRFQVWRGMRLLKRADQMLDAAGFMTARALELKREAARLIGKNTQAPSTLLDRAGDDR